MNKTFLGIIFIGLVFVSGCSQGDDIYIKNVDTSFFNSYFANGLSCFGFLGSNLTGLDGGVNREYFASNFPFVVVVDTFYLANSYDYVVDANYTLTFLNPVWNDQEIGVCLATSNTTWSNSVYLGANCTGLDGGINRVLDTNITYPLLIVVDNNLLSVGFDFTLSSGNVTFLNPVWDDMVISVWG